MTKIPAQNKNVSDKNFIEDHELLFSYDLFWNCCTYCGLKYFFCLEIH